MFTIPFLPHRNHNQVLCQGAIYFSLLTYKIDKHGGKSHPFPISGQIHFDPFAKALQISLQQSSFRRPFCPKKSSEA